MNITAKYFSATAGLEKVKFLPLLLMRLMIAYGFYGPAIMKWDDINSISEWFESLGIPLPYLNAYLAAGTETLGVVLLFLGLGTRFITIPLIITMLVAIKTVHWENGFEAGENGFEIPLYYIIMLLTLFIYGPGKLSLDRLIEKKFRS
ncbi:MAG: DoxX family protein [Pedobacter sp.]|jgi:putative oxidoreductase